LAPIGQIAIPILLIGSEVLSSDAMSDESDDDGYYERLAAAAQMGDGVHGEEDVPEVEHKDGDVCAASEDSYFERLQREGESQSVILEESDSVWAALEASSAEKAFAFVEIAHGHKQLALEAATRWLVGCLPASAKFLHTFRDSLTSESWRPFLDNRRQPKALVLVKHKAHDATGAEFEVCFFSEHAEADNYALSACGVLRGLHSTPNLEFSGLPARFLAVFEKGLLGLGLFKNWDALVDLFVLGSSLPVAPDLPQGFTLAPLPPEDAGTVNATWAHKHAGSEHYIAGCLAKFPSVGIRAEDGTLVGWILTYHYGAVGFLYVCPEYRKRGFAEILSIRVLQDWLQFTPRWPSGPYCYIVQDNHSSKRLYRKLGFNSTDLTYWAGFSCSSVIGQH